MNDLPACFSEPIPQPAAFAEMIRSRPDEVVLVTSDPAGAKALREWGLVAVSRPVGGLWTPDALSPLVGRDVALVNERPCSDLSLFKADLRTLEFTARRSGIVAPLAFTVSNAPADLAEYVEREAGLGNGPQTLVIEALAALTDQMPRVPLPDPIEPDWPPLRLRDRPPVETFPEIVLPDEVADFVRDVSSAIGCPPDFVGLPALVVAGAAIGRSASLQLKPNYFATASLYGLTVGHPSSGKSPALDAALRPFLEIDEALHEEYKALKQRYDEEVAAISASPKRSSKHPTPVKPVLESAILEDFTVEAAALLLEKNSRGLLAARDEGSAWMASLNQYKQSGRGSDRQFWLSALFSKTIRVDRKGNPDGVPVRIPHPFLCFIGGMPPDMLTTLREHAGKSDGFLERILFAFPDALPRPRWSERGIPEEAQERWGEIVRKLRARPMRRTEEGKLRPHVFQLNAEAKALWVEWYDAQADRINDPGFSSVDLALEGKLCDFAARLALILHLMRLACDPFADDPERVPCVSKWAVAGAIKLWSYFRSHHQRVRAHLDGVGQGTTPETSRLVRRWLENHPESTSFSESDLTRVIPQFCNDRASMEDGLAWLAKRNAIRRVPTPERPKGTPGRKRSPIWEVHPQLRELENQENKENRV